MKFTPTLKTTILFLLIGSSIFAQKYEPKERLLEPDHVLESKITNRNYELYISFPEDYTVKDSISYPVLYILDGLYYFPAINQAKETMGWGGQLEDLIIVGLSSGVNNDDWFVNRTLDYTTSVSLTDEKRFEKSSGSEEGSLKSGGAAKFLEVLKDEIIPFVDKHYKTNANRGIAGHSFGGLFAAYCLINSPTLFTKYSINSPSFWWDNQELFLKAKSTLSEFGNFEIEVFISVGSLENPNILIPAFQFYYDLRRLKSKGINVEWRLFEDEGHFSVVPAALSRTLSVLYRK